MTCSRKFYQSPFYISTRHKARFSPKRCENYVLVYPKVSLKRLLNPAALKFVKI